ncbi:cytochrome c-type biogenesis protein CcmH [Bacillus sp. FJAT-18017]|uniref:cytochrome c-type biogenesis protein CcmH n=1 Tax=Bacillus sp. FJAT-18017 TaxID=1705566 RepID=UPI0006AFCFDC|nr:cytochrome c-type biogenesis protein CcmH [Bacillus sp. FJAT-18017]
MGRNGLVKNASILAALLLVLLPSAALAAYTANSPEFREVVGELHMDGHSEHELTTCKVRKVYNSEVLDMLNEGMKPDEVIKHYTDELGPQALKIPERQGSGLLAWLIPGAGVLAGGAAVSIAIRRVTTAKSVKPSTGEEMSPHTSREFSSLEKTLDNERKRHF